MVKTHLKYALHAYIAAHPPTPKIWAEMYSVRYRLRQPDTRVQREARPQEQHQTPQLPSPDTLCGLSTCPGRTAVPRPSSRTSTFMGCMEHLVGTGGHRTSPSCQGDCPAHTGAGQVHLTHGEEAPQDPAGGLGLQTVLQWMQGSGGGWGPEQACCVPAGSGCPGFSSAPPRRPAPLSWGLTGGLLLPGASEGGVVHLTWWPSACLTLPGPSHPAWPRARNCSLSIDLHPTPPLPLGVHS